MKLSQEIKFRIANRGGKKYGDYSRGDWAAYLGIQYSKYDKDTERRVQNFLSDLKRGKCKKYI